MSGLRVTRSPVPSPAAGLRTACWAPAPVPRIPRAGRAAGARARGGRSRMDGRGRPASVSRHASSSVTDTAISRSAPRPAGGGSVPRARAPAPPVRAEEVETEVSEEVLEEAARRGRRHPCPRRRSEIGAAEDVLLGVLLVHAGMAVLVVQRALLRVGKDGVGLRDLLEGVLRLLLLFRGDPVGVVAKGELPVAFRSSSCVAFFLTPRTS